MADNNPVGEARILPPDTALHEKLGTNVSFDQVVSPKVIASAEQVIVNSADEILAIVTAELARLQQAVKILTVGTLGQTALSTVIETAFAIKSNAGLCGYPFASLLAKSLHVFCEMGSVQSHPLSPKTLEIIRAQAVALKTIFANKITGDGGKTGQAILQELQKLSGDFQIAS